MPLLYYIQTSLIGLIITWTIYFHMRYQELGRTRTQSVFKGLIFTNSALLLLEMLLNILTGGVSGTARLLLPAVVCVFYILNPIPEALWVIYLDSFIQNSSNRTRRIFLAVVVLPWLVTTVYSALSLINGAAYYIDPANVYHRGPGFWLMPAACYSYIAIYLVHALRNRKALPKQSFTTLLIVALPPIIAGILQVLFFGISVLWLALSFSLLITYLNLQSTYANMDYLTGLANRRQFAIVFRAYSRKKRIVGGIMMDIDDFKHINDVYGHLMGDMVLEKTGCRIVKHLGQSAF
jgi:GGDEF domain-containing protein